MFKVMDYRKDMNTPRDMIEDAYQHSGNGKDVEAGLGARALL